MPFKGLTGFKKSPSGYFHPNLSDMTGGGLQRYQSRGDEQVNRVASFQGGQAVINNAATPPDFAPLALPPTTGWTTHSRGGSNSQYSQWHSQNPISQANAWAAAGGNTITRNPGNRRGNATSRTQSASFPWREEQDNYYHNYSSSQQYPGFEVHSSPPHSQYQAPEVPRQQKGKGSKNNQQHNVLEVGKGGEVPLATVPAPGSCVVLCATMRCQNKYTNTPRVAFSKVVGGTRNAAHLQITCTRCGSPFLGGQQYEWCKQFSEQNVFGAGGFLRDPPDFIYGPGRFISNIIQVPQSGFDDKDYQYNRDYYARGGTVKPPQGQNARSKGSPAAPWHDRAQSRSDTRAKPPTNSAGWGGYAGVNGDYQHGAAAQSSGGVASEQGKGAATSSAGPFFALWTRTFNRHSIPLASRSRPCHQPSSSTTHLSVWVYSGNYYRSTFVISGGSEWRSTARIPFSCGGSAASSRTLPACGRSGCC